MASHCDSTKETAMTTSPIESTSTFMNTGLELFSDTPFKVADLSAKTVKFGRKEIDLALEPGLALLQNVGPVLFGGVRCLFLRVMA